MRGISFCASFHFARSRSQVSPVGLEVSRETREKTTSESFWAENGTSDDNSKALPADLASVVAAWPKLSSEARRAILGLVRKAATGR